MKVFVVIDPTLQEMISLAIDASKNAYIPYSHYPVGCALRSGDGTLYSGCNIESAAFSPTCCAERTALVKAVSEGQRAFDLLVVVTENAALPCGVCRQFLNEFAPTLRVVAADMTGKIVVDTTLDKLLPGGFGPADLVER